MPLLRLALIFASGSLFPAASAEGPRNLLRNGSFEGGTRYWYEAEGRPLAKDAADGRSSLRIEKGGIQSAAFLLEPNRPVTIAFSARADAPTVMGWQCSPCSREAGVKAGQTWSMRARHPIELGTTWRRFAVEFTPSAPQDGFWPRPTYMLQLGDADKPILIDAVTVAHGAGTEQYVPYREVEAQVSSPDLKGYRDPSGNILEHGSTVRLMGAVSNPGTKPRSLTLRWQWIDYEGVVPFGAAVERRVTVPAGGVVEESAALKLEPRGLVLGRFSAFEGDRLLDSSDLPVCSLPYPKAATRPDPRERFGVSIFGPHNAALSARAGFAWTRWYPHTGWEDHQPEGPGKWTWFDAELDGLAGLGISNNVVLYGKPKWAFEAPGDLLPKDMKWPADDPRWADLGVETSWDRFVAGAARHYKGRSLVYEVINEPEFDWDKQPAVYTKFNVRTARLIKKADPSARVMIDNVYAIPSRLNYQLLKEAAREFDIVSWHDYHDGWLADGPALRRMRIALDDLGGNHLEIWFNEGWAFTNTAEDEPAVALTGLNAWESTNATVDSVAELTAEGQDKTILFFAGYEEHGMSFWDYAGPGTMLWDYHGNPLPILPAWNVLGHHIGLSDRVASIRPPGANFRVFEDRRDRGGVAVCYADRGASADVAVKLPISGLRAEDAMGNPVPLAGGVLTLSKSGRPVYLRGPRVSGQALAKALAPLDRKLGGFANADGTEIRLPATWEGGKAGTADGNPLLGGGKPAWRLDQVWPDDPTRSGNYSPLVWAGTEWVPERNGFGGQPAAKVADGAFRSSARGSWSGSEGQRLAALVFVAPRSGVYTLRASATSKPWEGGAEALELRILKKDTQRAVDLKTVTLPRGRAEPFAVEVDLSAGHELVLVPWVPHWHNASEFTVEKLVVTGPAR